MDEIRERFIRILNEKILFVFTQEEREKITDQTSFMDDGIMDSAGALSLIDEVEKEFGITIGDWEITRENLDTIADMVFFIKEKLSNAS